MVRANYAHIDVIRKILKDEDEDTQVAAILALRDHRILMFINDEQTAYVMYTPADTSTYLSHIQSLPEGRGRKLWDFMRDTGVYLFENTEATTIMSFVSRDNRALNVLLRRLGATYQGDLSDRHLFTIEKKDKQRILDKRL